MRDYIILTDSSCDLSADMAEKLGVEIIPLVVTADGVDYKNYADEREITYKDFYEKLRGGADCSTSAVSIDTYMTAMEKIIQSGKDIMCIAFSSGLSATCSSAQIAARELGEKYPDASIFVTDSLCASLGQGLLVKLCADMKAGGASLTECAKYAEDTKLHICHWFSVSDFKLLHKGGRVSRTVAIAGTLLNIKPVMHVSEEGKLTMVSKVRGKKSLYKDFAERMKKTAIEPENQTVFVSHGDCIEDVEELCQVLKSEVGFKDVYVNYVGPVIGAHSGPGTLALFYVGTER